MVKMGVYGALPNMLICGINPFKCGTDLNTSFRCRARGRKQYIPIILICQKVMKMAKWEHRFAVLMPSQELLSCKRKKANPLATMCCTSHANCTSPRRTLQRGGMFSHDSHMADYRISTQQRLIKLKTQRHLMDLTGLPDSHRRSRLGAS